MWILIHSYIFWAGQRAACRPGGLNLGFEEVEKFWRGIQDLKRSQILPEAVAISRKNCGPVFLVVHAGGNELCFLKIAELIMLMQTDLERLPFFFSFVIVA